MAKIITLIMVFGYVHLIYQSPASSHEWKDRSGRYKVEAELVSANSELVVLRTADHRLIALDLVVLSDQDRDFVRTEMAKLTQATVDVKSSPRVPILPETRVLKTNEKLPDVNSKELPLSEQSSVAERTDANVGGWRLIDGESILGEFMGFDLKPLVIKRALSEVYVGGVVFAQLDPFYKHILPMTIAKLENAKIDDVRDIENWLKKSGPGPWVYKIEAVLIETPARGTVSIPTFLLDKRTAESIAVPLRRWREALATEVAEEDRNLYFDRERFLTRAAKNAQLVDDRVEQQARYMRLELLATASGATDLWNVSLVPQVGYGHPYSVIVPGQNSLQAEAIATQRFPGYRVGGVVKHTP
ncbi:MAG TPA: SHD1 domain-containing protein [Pirellula sp.]|nr:SHD1 domain-containing protein [Pirellula sp.]